MKNILVLFSGGADSALLLYMARVSAGQNTGDNGWVGVVSFSYGQVHSRELAVARDFLDKHRNLWNADFHQEIDTSGVTSPLLKGRDCKPRSGVHEKHVPARNLMFIAHAAAIAESQGYDEIWYGADYSDRENLFPDCYQEWVVKMNQVLAINGSRPIKLVAPLLGMSKEEVLVALENCGVRREEIFSGYVQ